jgi:hypothetical protein
MDTSASNPNALAKSLAAALVLSVVAVLMIASRLSPSSAALQERIFENKIPAHIPIKIKIRKEKEKSFKDLKNEKWLREFELELTNTGDKPIYFLYITMDTNVKFDGSGPEIVFPLTYGRAELGDILTNATSDDVPIKPGEKIILTAGEATAWEKGVREKRWPQSTKFRAEIQVLSFGDGTGYFGTELYPPPGRPKAAGNNVKQPQSQKAQRRPRERLIGKLGVQSTSTSRFNQPAFMSAYFLSSENVITAVPSAAQPFVECPFTQCTPVIPWTGYVCYDNDENKTACRIQNRPTPDQISGVCRELEFKTTLCIAGEIIYACQVINVHECGFGPGPTPTPTPKPSPQPCSYCADPNALHPADCANPSQPTCDPLNFEYEQNGCCYKQTCERAGINPPPPQPCPPGEFRSSNELRPFPLCDYLPCVPIPEPTPTPDPPPPPPPPGECNQFPSVCDPPDGWSWDYCCCVNEYLLNNGSWPCTDTPVIYDSNHNGLDLSDAEHGVAFDIDANGSLDIIGWPIDPDDKLLVYDRNGNGKVDDARELFGNKTPQPDSPSGWAQNGFLALAEFDKPKNGGNNDGLFSIADRGFSLLRLWSDKHRNGTSESDELETLPTDLVIELKYHRMNKYDRNGNRLRYRSGKWVWDVIFARAKNPFKRSKPAW